MAESLSQMQIETFYLLFRYAFGDACLSLQAALRSFFFQKNEKLNILFVPFFVSY